MRKRLYKLPSETPPKIIDQILFYQTPGAPPVHQGAHLFMKRLDLLNNIERARLMHQLLPTEMPGLLQCMDAVSKIVLRNADDLRASWSNPIIHVQLWIRLADALQQEISSQAGKFKTPNSFAEHLFGGYLGLFSAHCVCLYAEKTDNPKFKAIATLFLGYDPNEQ
jgi:hypothetical protein